MLALQRSIGNRATRLLLRNQGRRRSYVFIMGVDRRGDPNRFYSAALRYWRAHRPNATFVTDQRNLADLLSWVRANVRETEPIGELFIVSHANEDGTLSFGLNAADQDAHLSFSELREALAGRALPQLGRRVDNLTRIHIKGCDIGRSQEMIELVDRAFGGAGTVTAPTHEQGYGWDQELAARGRRAAQDRIRREVEAANPEPPVVDPTLTGAARTRAQRERQRAMADRRRTIRQEMRARGHEVQAAAELAGTIEQFSGPMFQRPGDRLFTVDELRGEVDRAYPHLTQDQRKSLARRLAARDRRSQAVQRSQGTFRQTGQRVDRRTETFAFPEPRTLVEAQRVYGRAFQANRFTPRAVVQNERVAAQGGFRVRTVIRGGFRPRGEEPFDGEMSFTAPFDAEGAETIAPSNAALLATARSRVANPEKYRWTVTEDHSANGRTTLTAAGERVIAYVHHGSLNVTPREHFTVPITDPRFFATSRFAPPRAAAGGP